jgi:hypothetical protein
MIASGTTIRWRAGIHPLKGFVLYSLLIGLGQSEKLAQLKDTVSGERHYWNSCCTNRMTADNFCKLRILVFKRLCVLLNDLFLHVNNPKLSDASECVLWELMTVGLLANNAITTLVSSR